ncbi:hypothetical protein CW304_20990 [Bacillus sp. UFRGS-B20]|nr:hypothetical protein CW304_20990 [Bacillus sp. UFRGS-B20]
MCRFGYTKTQELREGWILWKLEKSVKGGLKGIFRIEIFYFKIHFDKGPSLLQRSIQNAVLKRVKVVQSKG